MCMTFVTIDNDSVRLRELSNMIFQVWPGSIIYEFTDPMLAIKYICNNQVNKVVANRKMRPVDGEQIKSMIYMHKPEVMVELIEKT